MPFQQPEGHRRITDKKITKLRGHLLNLADGSSPADTLMTEMWGTDAVFTGQEDFRIAQSTG